MIRINLAPSGGARRRAAIRLPAPSLNLGVLFGVVYLAAILGIGAYWWSLSAEKARLAADVARATTEVASLKATIGQGTNVRNEVADMRKRVEVIESLTRGQSRPILMFDAFVDLIPRDLWVTALEDRGSILKVTGTAFSPTAVADLMSNLRASGRFKDVDIVVSRQDLTKTPRLVTFEVTCRFEG
jgi:Tfp pilus assembly protein PilN